jgi:hypothetical protein
VVVVEDYDQQRLALLICRAAFSANAEIGSLSPEDLNVQ